MKRLALFLLVVLNLASALPALAEDRCSTGLAGLGLSKALEELLGSEEWKKELFDVRVLHGEVGGKPRTMVLLGEVHVNSERGIEMVRKLRAHFDHYAVEGVAENKMWAQRLTWPVLKGLYHLVGRVSGRRAGSSITDTVVTHGQDAPETARLIVDAVRAKVAKLRRRGRPEDFEAAVSIAGTKLRMPLAGLEKFAEALDAEIEAGTLSKHVHLLERQRRPGVREQLGFAATGAILYGYLAAVGWLVFERLETLCNTDYRGFGDVCSAGGGVALTGVSAVALGVLALRAMGLVMNGTLVGERNESMAGAAVNAFANDDGNRLMLSIVGAGHVKGMIEIFRGYGFEEVPLKVAQ